VDRFGCVVLLKGDGSLIAAPDKGVLVDGGTPILATAGTGDVLTGIVAAFLAKGMDARLATAAAATAHHWAAMETSYEAGLTASDLLDTLPLVLAS
jgi:ADP-dependent NAD(P)H-hydrate dehydratase / NAD(P)H-hydrate epimerase